MYLETLNLKFKISLVTKMLVNVIKIKFGLVFGTKRKQK